MNDRLSDALVRLPRHRDRGTSRTTVLAVLLMVLGLGLALNAVASAAGIWAGVAKADITDRDAAPVNDPLYAKALVLRNDDTTAVLVTVDAVAIGQLGRITNDFLGNVRSQLQKELKIEPANVLVNASHCHGIVCADVEQRTVQAVKEAWQNMVPVNVGAGAGQENRIMENRRLKLKDGSEADVRHAYAMPRDEEVAGIGPTDSEIGLLRLDRKNGQPLAVVYNFACHPIQGVPSRGNTADLPGFASQAIEENLGDGVLALFVQGCAGDINPVRYKDVHHPRDAEPLGNMLGLSALRALKKIQTRESTDLKVINEVLALPRGADLEQRISALQAEQSRLLQSLKGTSLNLKTFLPLLVQYKLADDFPSYYSHGYLHEKSIGAEGLSKLDAENRANMEAYVAEHPDHGATDSHPGEHGFAQDASRPERSRRQGNDRCRGRRPENRGFRAGDVSGRIERPDRTEHQAAGSRGVHFRGRLYQRLHLLHTNAAAAKQPRLRAGGLRLPGGAGMAEAV